MRSSLVSVWAMANWLNTRKTKVKKKGENIKSENGLILEPACVIASKLSMKFQAMFIKSKNDLDSRLLQGLSGIS